MSQRYILEGEDTTLPNMLQIQVRKQRVTAAHYVLIYKGLQLMISNGNIPCSKYRISNRKAVIDAMVQNRFIEECDDKKRMVSEKLHRDAKYYCVAPRGFEYMRAFEKLEGLFD